MRAHQSDPGIRRLAEEVERRGGRRANGRSERKILEEILLSRSASVPGGVLSWIKLVIIWSYTVFPFVSRRSCLSRDRSVFDGEAAEVPAGGPLWVQGRCVEADLLGRRGCTGCGGGCTGRQIGGGTEELMDGGWMEMGD